MHAETTIATRRFEFTTSAGPDQVWAALTRPELTARYLYGMTLRSAWVAGASVVVHPPAGAGIADDLTGEVLAVEAGRRLSFTLGSGQGHPATYVTWEIDPAERGSRVRLYVDETESFAGDQDAEAAWLPAVSALRGVLSRLLL